MDNKRGKENIYTYIYTSPSPHPACWRAPKHGFWAEVLGPFPPVASGKSRRWENGCDLGPWEINRVAPGPQKMTPTFQQVSVLHFKGHHQEARFTLLAARCSGALRFESAGRVPLSPGAAKRPPGSPSTLALPPAPPSPAELVAACFEL